MWVVKTILREMFKLFQQRFQLFNIAQAQRPIIIRGLLCAQQQRQPHQPPSHRLNTAQVQKHPIFRDLLCALQR